MPDSVMAMPALAPAVMACDGVKEIVAVYCVPFTAVGKGGPKLSPLIYAMAGNVPIYVVSIMTGVPADKLFEVPAEICFGPCAAVGVVNFVTVKVTNVFALTPAGSFTVSTGM